MIGVFLYLAGLGAGVLAVTWGIVRGLDLLARCDADEYL